MSGDWKLAEKLCLLEEEAVDSDLRYTESMTRAARRLIDEALSLSDDERIEVAAELLASVEGESPADWEAAWAAELERREDLQRERGNPPGEWVEARARIAQRLASK
jgi:hypothetical protein